MLPDERSSQEGGGRFNISKAQSHLFKRMAYVILMERTAQLIVAETQLRKSCESAEPRRNTAWKI